MQPLDYDNEKQYHKNPLKDNAKRAKNVVNIFYAIIAINFISFISGYFEYELYLNIKNGDVYNKQEIGLTNLRSGIIGMVQIILYISTAVLFLNWFRRAYANLHRAGISIKHTDKAAVWSFFVPILNLYRPVQIMQEIWNKTRDATETLKPGIQPAYSSSIIGIWWTFFIIRNVINNINFRYNILETPENIDELISSVQFMMFSDVVEIPAALITILLVKRVSHKEQLFYEEVDKNPEMLDEDEEPKNDE